MTKTLIQFWNSWQLISSELSLFLQIGFCKNVSCLSFENVEPNIRWQQFPLLELTVSKLFKLQAAAHLRNTQLLICRICFFSVVLMDVVAQYFSHYLQPKLSEVWSRSTETLYFSHIRQMSRQAFWIHCSQTAVTLQRKWLHLWLLQQRPQAAVLLWALWVLCKSLLPLLFVELGPHRTLRGRASTGLNSWWFSEKFLLWVQRGKRSTKHTVHTCFSGYVFSGKL